jgi:chromosome segregation ATPase
MIFFNDLFIELTRILTRIITGRLLTEEQISGVTGTVIGKYFTDWFPQPQDEVEAETRVASAKHHIAEATRIIGGLKDDLDSQADQLEKLSQEIDEKRNTAERYAAMAATNEKAVAAFRSELEAALRRELTDQANRGKRLRQLASFTVWFVTLIMGAALGAYFPQIVHWIRSLGV